MKIGITYRLFLSILTATCLAFLCMFLIIQWSISKGFLRYLNEMEDGRLKQLSGSLEAAYAEHGSWDFLRDNPRFLIMQLFNTLFDDTASEKLKEFDKCGDVLPFTPPPGGTDRPRLPFIILDAERKPLLGNPAEAKYINLRPIVHNNETLGYMGLLPPKHFLIPPQEHRC